MGDITADDLRGASTSSISHGKRPSRARSLEKKLATEVEELKATYPDAEIQLWCEDEHRLGLKPILRRVYVPEGETPVANVNWRFKWLWLYAFVHPKTGETKGVDSAIRQYRTF